MPEMPNLDPLGLWREMLSQWERGVKSLSDQAMGSPDLSRAMQQITALSLQMQQSMGEAMGKSLQALNLPTRTDLLALTERVGRIEEALARLEAAAAVPATPARRHP